MIKLSELVLKYMYRAVMAAILLGTCSLAEAQSPLIQQVLQAASRKAPCDTCNFTSGSLAVVVGERLASASEAASTTPLPTTLAGTTVLIDNQPVPLFSVSPTEILIQLPNNVDLPAAVQPLVVRSNSGASSPFPMRVSPLGVFAVFTRDGTECGPPLLFNIDRSESGVRYVENSPETSTQRGAVITLFGTGLSRSNDFRNQWPVLGEPTPDGPGAPYFGMSAFVGDRAFPLGETLFSGRVPGLIGVDQVNIRIGNGAPEGCNLPIRLAVRGIPTPTTADFPLSIGSADQCATPPPSFDPSAASVETFDVAICGIAVSARSDRVDSV